MQLENTFFSMLSPELRLRIYDLLLPEDSIRFVVEIVNIGRQFNPKVDDIDDFDENLNPKRAQQHIVIYQDGLLSLLEPCPMREIYRTMTRVSKEAYVEWLDYFWKRVTVKFRLVDLDRFVSEQMYHDIDLKWRFPYRGIHKLEINFALNNGRHYPWNVEEKMHNRSDWKADNRGTVYIYLDPNTKTFTAKARPLVQQARMFSQGFGMELLAIRHARADVYAMVNGLNKQQALKGNMVMDMILQLRKWNTFTRGRWDQLVREGLTVDQSVEGRSSRNGNAMRAPDGQS